MLTTDKAFIPPRVMARAVGGELVILDLEHGTYFGLDAVGARAWQLLSEQMTVHEICDVMLEEYEVSRSDLEKDLLNLFDSLEAQGLIQIAGSDGAKP